MTTSLRFLLGCRQVKSGCASMVMEWSTKTVNMLTRYPLTAMDGRFQGLRIRRFPTFGAYRFDSGPGHQKVFSHAAIQPAV